MQISISIISRRKFGWVASSQRSRLLILPLRKRSIISSVRWREMLKIVIPNAGSTCCPIHLKQAERPSHIDKQGNADTTADTGAKLKETLI